MDYGHGIISQNILGGWLLPFCSGYSQPGLHCGQVFRWGHRRKVWPSLQYSYKSINGRSLLVATVMGSLRGRHELSKFTSLFTVMHWKKYSHSSVLRLEIPGTGTWWALPSLRSLQSPGRLKWFVALQHQGSQNIEWIAYPSQEYLPDLRCLTGVSLHCWADSLPFIIRLSTAIPELMKLVVPCLSRVLCCSTDIPWWSIFAQMEMRNTATFNKHHQSINEKRLKLWI